MNDKSHIPAYIDIILLGVFLWIISYITFYDQLVK